MHLLPSVTFPALPRTEPTLEQTHKYAQEKRWVASWVVGSVGVASVSCVDAVRELATGVLAVGCTLGKATCQQLGLDSRVHLFNHFDEGARVHFRQTLRHLVGVIIALVIGILAPSELCPAMKAVGFQIVDVTSKPSMTRILGRAACLAGLALGVHYFGVKWLVKETAAVLPVQPFYWPSIKQTGCTMAAMVAVAAAWKMRTSTPPEPANTGSTQAHQLGLPIPENSNPNSGTIANQFVASCKSDKSISDVLERVNTSVTYTKEDGGNKVLTFQDGLKIVDKGSKGMEISRPGQDSVTYTKEEGGNKILTFQNGLKIVDKGSKGMEISRPGQDPVSLAGTFCGRLPDGTVVTQNYSSVIIWSTNGKQITDECLRANGKLVVSNGYVIAQGKADRTNVWSAKDQTWTTLIDCHARWDHAVASAQGHIGLICEDEIVIKCPDETVLRSQLTDLPPKASVDCIKLLPNGAMVVGFRYVGQDGNDRYGEGSYDMRCFKILQPEGMALKQIGTMNIKRYFDLNAYVVLNQTIFLIPLSNEQIVAGVGEDIGIWKTDGTQCGALSRSVAEQLALLERWNVPIAELVAPASETITGPTSQSPHPVGPNSNNHLLGLPVTQTQVDATTKVGSVDAGLDAEIVLTKRITLYLWEPGAYIYLSLKDTTNWLEKFTYLEPSAQNSSHYIQYDNPETCEKEYWHLFPSSYTGMWELQQKKHNDYLKPMTRVERCSNEPLRSTRLHSEHIDFLKRRAGISTSVQQPAAISTSIQQGIKFWVGSTLLPSETWGVPETTEWLKNFTYDGFKPEVIDLQKGYHLWQGGKLWEFQDPMANGSCPVMHYPDNKGIQHAESTLLKPEHLKFLCEHATKRGGRVAQEDGAPDGELDQSLRDAFRLGEMLGTLEN